MEENEAWKEKEALQPLIKNEGQLKLFIPKTSDLNSLESTSFTSFHGPCDETLTEKSSS